MTTTLNAAVYSGKKHKETILKKRRSKLFQTFFVIYKSTCTIFISPANLWLNICVLSSDMETSEAANGVILLHMYLKLRYFFRSKTGFGNIAPCRGLLDTRGYSFIEPRWKYFVSGTVYQKSLNRHQFLLTTNSY